MLFKLLKSASGIFLATLFIFTLLLFKDPFSQRNLISNFEPIPDAFHYVIPAVNFVKGDGFNLSREGRVLKSQVAPLYSFSLIPLYFINNDPRIFYFTNILLALLSFFFFYKIVSRISSNNVITFIALILYITNYHLYWYPTLAMAENLMLLIFLIAVYLILLPVKFKYIVMATFIALSFYATKYASAPLTIIYILTYGLKTFFSEKRKKNFLIYLSFIFILFLTFALYFYFFRQINIGVNILYYMKVIAGFSFNQSDVFSLNYIQINLPQYLSALTGNQTKVLWDTTPLVPKIVAILGLAGLIIGCFKSRIKYFCISLILLLSGSIFFMSTFYSFDGRYIFQAIPTLILGFIIFLNLVWNFLIKFNMKKIAYVLILVFITWYFVDNGLRVKNQIMLNLRYSETPWYYVSVLELNKYFTKDLTINQKKPIVISAVSPYFIDFFSNKNYILLPLSQEQEFRSAKEIVWGINDYSDLFKLYEKYLKEGFDVYVSKYGLGNEAYLHRDFEAIKKRFKFTEVVDGCFNVCNIYRLELKNTQ